MILFAALNSFTVEETDWLRGGGSQGALVPPLPATATS